MTTGSLIDKEIGGLKELILLGYRDFNDFKKIQSMRGQIMSA